MLKLKFSQNSGADKTVVEVKNVQFGVNKIDMVIDVNNYFYYFEYKKYFSLSTKFLKVCTFHKFSRTETQWMSIKLFVLGAEYFFLSTKCFKMCTISSFLSAETQSTSIVLFDLSTQKYFFLVQNILK